MERRRFFPLQALTNSTTFHPHLDAYPNLHRHQTLSKDMCQGIEITNESIPTTTSPKEMNHKFKRKVESASK